MSGRVVRIPNRNSSGLLIGYLYGVIDDERVREEGDLLRNAQKYRQLMAEGQDVADDLERARFYLSRAIAHGGAA